MVTNPNKSIRTNKQGMETPPTKNEEIEGLMYYLESMSKGSDEHGEVPTLGTRRSP